VKGRKGGRGLLLWGGTGEKKGKRKEREREGKEMKGRAHHSTTDSFRHMNFTKLNA